MKWNELKEEEQLDMIKKESEQQPVLIFKHSTRCSISATALSRVERSWNGIELEDIKPYFLDLLNYRGLSDKVAREFNIPHESPQALLIKNGKCIYHSSHLAINCQEIGKQAATV